jgi:hypothetical protein
MIKWMTNSCHETKEVLGIDYRCCGSCHEDVEYGMRDCIEHYTKFKDLLFYACCGFPELDDYDWKKFEAKLENGM